MDIPTFMRRIAALRDAASLESTQSALNAKQ
jgi:hypothetical protein